MKLPLSEIQDASPPRRNRCCSGEPRESTHPKSKLPAEQGFITEAAPANNTASVNNFDPVLISLVRRAMPNLIAYDVCGVQPMNGPTGLIFAMKSRYQGGSTSNREALFNEAETQFSGDSSGTHDSDNASGFNGVDSDGARLTNLAAGGMPTDDAEALGSSGGSSFNEMGFTIERQTVTAKSHVR